MASLILVNIGSGNGLESNLSEMWINIQIWINFKENTFQNFVCKISASFVQASMWL